MKSNFGIKLLELLLVLFILLTLITLFTLPLLVNKYAVLTGQTVSDTFSVTIFLYLTAIPFLILLIMARRLCQNILAKNPFSHSSFTSLRIISICAFIDFALYVIGTLVILKNLLTLTLMIAAFMVGLVALVLSQLVRVALDLKEENELTI